MESKELAEALVSDARYFNPMLRVSPEDFRGGVPAKYATVLKKYKLMDRFNTLVGKFDETGELKKNLQPLLAPGSSKRRKLRSSRGSI